MRQHDGYRILDLETYYRKDIYRRFTRWRALRFPSPIGLM